MIIFVPVSILTVSFFFVLFIYSERTTNCGNYHSWSEISKTKIKGREIVIFFLINGKRINFGKR